MQQVVRAALRRARPISDTPHDAPRDATHEATPVDAHPSRRDRTPSGAVAADRPRSGVVRRAMTGLGAPRQNGCTAVRGQRGGTPSRWDLLHAGAPHARGGAPAAGAPPPRQDVATLPITADHRRRPASVDAGTIRQHGVWPRGHHHECRQCRNTTRAADRRRVRHGTSVPQPQAARHSCPHLPCARAAGRTPRSHPIWILPSRRRESAARYRPYGFPPVRKAPYVA